MMLRDIAALFLLAAAAWSADTDFNGRWDITVTKGKRDASPTPPSSTGTPQLPAARGAFLERPRRRAWWLQVDGAGTPAIKGKFVGFPGGDLNDIQHIWIDHGELRFTYDGKDVHQEYRAHMVGTMLQGTLLQGDAKLEWAAAPSPQIGDADDGSWHEAQPIQVFNGRDISNWYGLTKAASPGWSVEDGILKGNGAATDLISNEKFWNFKLHVEYRTPAHSNSGIGLRGRYEVQILEDYGRPLDRHSNAALYSRIVPTENVTKPAGEWQIYDIRLVGRHVVITLNGKTVTQGVIDGLTALACDADEGVPGPLMLQGDHGPVEFRSIVLTPLVK